MSHQIHSRKEKPDDCAFATTIETNANEGWAAPCHGMKTVRMNRDGANENENWETNTCNKSTISKQGNRPCDAVCGSRAML
jgi:hypothetical protein